MTDRLHAAYHCAAEVIRRRRLTGQPVPAWLRQHYAELDAAVRMSRSGHESDSATAELEPVDQITANEAAAIVGKSKRQTQRLAADLGGRIVGGRWLFDRAAVTEYAANRGEL